MKNVRNCPNQYLEEFEISVKGFPMYSLFNFNFLTCPIVYIFIHSLSPSHHTHYSCNPDIICSPLYANLMFTYAIFGLCFFHNIYSDDIVDGKINVITSFVIEIFVIVKMLGLGRSLRMTQVKMKRRLHFL